VLYDIWESVVEVTINWLCRWENGRARLILALLLLEGRGREGE
jgi:hypothetical protein